MKLLILILSLTSLNSFSFVDDNLVAVKGKILIEEIKDEIPEWDKRTIKRVEKYAPLIIRISNEIGIDPKLVLSVAWAESHFKPNAKSYAGALGIMQVKPDTQEYILQKEFKKENLVPFYTLLVFENSLITTDIIDNILAGALYLKYLVNKFDNIQKAIVAYNEGPRGTYRLIKKKFDLNKHEYFLKVNQNIIAMN